MGIFKQIIKSEIVKKMACKLIYIYIKFLFVTSEIKTIFKDSDFKAQRKLQCIFATWHSRVLIMPITKHSDLPSCAIVSDHNDGRLIGEVIKQAGIELIYGSSNRRRLSSLKEIIAYIKKGYNFLITPDGPRGPAEQINGAIINIASSSNLPIIPAICAYKRFKQFNSWDKFIFPYPFNKIAIVFGKPIYIPNDLSLEQRAEYAEILRNSLNEITTIADDIIKKGF